MINAAVKRDWYKAEHILSPQFCKTARTCLLKNMGQCGPKSSTDAQVLCLGSTGSMCENLTRSFKTTPVIRVLDNGMCLVSRLKRCLGASKDQRTHRSTRKSKRSSCNCTALVFVEDLAGGVWMTPEENRGWTWEGKQTLRIYTVVTWWFSLACLNARRGNSWRAGIVCC